MPKAPLRPCPRPYCGALIPRGANLCPRHQREQDKLLDQARGSATARGYTSPDWRALRKLVIERDRVCKSCGHRPATDAAHIVARRDGGKDEAANLRGLCHACHSRETALKDGRWGGR